MPQRFYLLRVTAHVVIVATTDVTGLTKECAQHVLICVIICVRMGANSLVVQLVMGNAQVLAKRAVIKVQLSLLIR